MIIISKKFKVYFIYFTDKTNSVNFVPKTNAIHFKFIAYNQFETSLLSNKYWLPKIGWSKNVLSWEKNCVQKYFGPIRLCVFV